MFPMKEIMVELMGERSAMAPSFLMQETILVKMNSSISQKMMGISCSLTVKVIWDENSYYLWELLFFIGKIYRGIEVRN